MPRFLRSYELLIGSAGSTGTLINEHQISFDIERSSDSNMNSGVFRIFNLSNETRQKIQELEQRDGILTFKVGYRGEEQVQIFSGNVITVTSTPKSPDVITEIVCGDGYTAYRDAKTNRSFPEKTDLRTILTAFIADMQVSLGVLKGEDLDHVYNNGVSETGRTTDLMDNYTTNSAFNLEWSIQDGVANVFPRGGATQETAIVINEASGLIGTPEPTGKRPGAEKGSTEPQSGAKITTLCNPGLFINKKVKLESKYLNGDFVCAKVVHTGDYEGTGWYSIADLVVEEERT